MKPRHYTEYPEPYPGCWTNWGQINAGVNAVYNESLERRPLSEDEFLVKYYDKRTT